MIHATSFLCLLHKAKNVLLLSAVIIIRYLALKVVLIVIEIVVMDANYTKDIEMDRVIVPLDDLKGSSGKDSLNYVATLPKVLTL